MPDPAVPAATVPPSPATTPSNRRLHHIARSRDHSAAAVGVEGGRAASAFVALAKGVAAVFGNAYVLAFSLVWIFLWVIVDLVTAMKFDTNFALLLALTGIPQLPLGTAILVVSNVTQRTQDAISEAQGETLQHLADLTAAVKEVNDEQLAILRVLQERATGAPPAR